MNNKSNTEKFCGGFAVHERRFFFNTTNQKKEGMNMKLLKEVIKNNKKMIILYVVIGIMINFIELYGITYYQKILDAFQYKNLTIMPLIIYGLLLIIQTILGYIDNYPEQQIKNKLNNAVGKSHLKSFNQKSTIISLDAKAPSSTF